jgi:serine/threonine protein kinase
VFRNRHIGHGAPGQEEKGHYQRLGDAMMRGVVEILGELDVLAGRRLICVRDVKRQRTGDWIVQRFELRGESPNRLEPINLPETAAASVPHPGCSYLESSVNRARPTLHCLEPLLFFDFDSSEFYYLNGVRKQQRCDYLCYTTNKHLRREAVLVGNRRLLEHIIGGEIAERDSELSTAEVSSQEVADQDDSVATLGEFELIARIGRGSMGEVYRAWQPSTNRQVAVKMLLRPGDDELARRFSREIHALGRVDHYNVVRVFSSEVVGDRWFYAMELVEGTDLAAICAQLGNTGASQIRRAQWQEALSTACNKARDQETILSDRLELGPNKDDPRRKLPWSRPAQVASSEDEYSHIDHVVEIIRQISLATHALHSADIVHRDIKPSNIMVTSDGKRAVLTDLGIAQLADQVSGKLTRTRQFIGTLRYASPEQVMCARDVDHRTDVYSIGATAWELLTLQPLFNASDETTTLDLMLKIQRDEPEPIRKHNPRVHMDLEAIVHKCLEKERSKRYACAADLAADLDRFKAGERPRARRLTPLYLLKRTLARDRRRVVAIASVAALLLAIFCGLWLSRWRAEQSRIRGEYATAVASTPGLNGQWWFDETPWLIPPLRQAMIQTIERGKYEFDDAPDPARSSDILAVHTSLEDLKRHCVEEEMLEQSDIAFLGELEALTRQKLGHRQLAERLSSLVGRLDGQRAEDHHTRATLRHKLALIGGSQGDRLAYAEAADVDYARAAEAYDQQYGPEHPLKQVCLIDWGRLVSLTLLKDGNGGPDDEQYDRARVEMFRPSAENWTEAPPAFRVDALVSFAMLSYGARRQREAIPVFEKAIESAEEAEFDSGEHPLLAHAHERFAWNLMDAWEPDKAKQQFARAKDLRKLALDSNPWSQSYWYHNRHGMAMALRYADQIADARQEYDGIIQELRGTVANFHGESEDGAPLAAEIQRALEVRLQNSLERRADCELYRGTLPDAQLAHAADLYQEAFQLSATNDVKAVMAAKRTIALALSGNHDDAREVRNSWISEAGEVRDIGRQASNVRLEPMDRAAKLMVELATSKPTEARESIAEFLESMELAERSRLDRDVLETRLLLAEILLSTPPADGGDLRLFDSVMDDLVAQDNIQSLRKFLNRHYSLGIDAAIQRERPEYAMKYLARRGDELPEGALVIHAVGENLWAVFAGDREQHRLERNEEGYRLPEALLEQITGMQDPPEPFSTDSATRFRFIEDSGSLMLRQTSLTNVRADNDGTQAQGW